MPTSKRKFINYMATHLQQKVKIPFSYSVKSKAEMPPNYIKRNEFFRD